MPMKDLRCAKCGSNDVLDLPSKHRVAIPWFQQLQYQYLTCLACGYAECHLVSKDLEDRTKLENFRTWFARMRQR